MCNSATILMLLSVVMHIGTFHQFDCITCPEKPVKTGASSMPDHDELQQRSLCVYLLIYKKSLEAYNVTDISSISFIFHIFCQLHSPKVHYNDRSHPWPAKGVLQVCTCVNGSKLL